MLAYKFYFVFIFEFSNNIKTTNEKFSF